MGLTGKSEGVQPLEEKGKAVEAYLEVSREVMKDMVLDKLDMASGKKPRIEATPSAMGQEESMEMKAKTAVVDARREMKKKGEAGKVLGWESDQGGEQAQ